MLNIVIPYDWNEFVNHVKSLMISYQKWIFFKAMTISMWYIIVLTNNHFQMEDDKKHEVGDFLNFHFKHFLVD